MSKVEHTAKTNVNLADLLSVQVNSKPLEIVLSNILTRLDDLEEDHPGEERYTGKHKDEGKKSGSEKTRDKSRRRDKKEAKETTKKDKSKQYEKHKDRADRKEKGSGPSEAQIEDEESSSSEKSASEEEAAAEPLVGEPGGPDLTEAVRKLQIEMKKEQKNGTKRDKRLGKHEKSLGRLGKKCDDLADDIFKALDGIEDLQEETERLENVKADKPNAGAANQHDVTALQDDLHQTNDELAALKAKVAILEGVLALAHPEVAKELGLTSFADQMSDFMRQLKIAESQFKGVDRRVDSNMNNVQEQINQLKNRLTGLGFQGVDSAEYEDEVGIGTYAEGSSEAHGPYAISPAGGGAEEGEQGRGAAAAHACKVLGMTPRERQMMYRTRQDVDDILKDLGLTKLTQRSAKNKTEGGVGVAGRHQLSPSDGRDKDRYDSSAPLDLSEVERRLRNLEREVDTLDNEFNEDKMAKARKIANLETKLDDHAGQLKDQKKELQTLAQETSKNTDHCMQLDEKKMDKADFGDVNTLQDIARNFPAMDDKVIALQNICESLGDRISALQQEKASKEPIQQLTKDVNELKILVKNTGGKGFGGDQQGTSEGENGGDGFANAGAVKTIADHCKNLEKWAKEQMVDLRVEVEHLQHNKADSLQVANKAERDYVENAMEKLMHEIENVLNATNAGMIDTFDKSLNILRDMIDGKATKSDVNKLQSLIQQADAMDASAAGPGNPAVPEGLTGYKTYRCLGCNRPMEGMRPRAIGVSTGNLINRVPANVKQTNAEAAVTLPRALMNGPAE